MTNSAGKTFTKRKQLVPGTKVQREITNTDSNSSCDMVGVDPDGKTADRSSDVTISKLASHFFPFFFTFLMASIMYI